jgi:hypothetical protein
VAEDEKARAQVAPPRVLTLASATPPFGFAAFDAESSGNSLFERFKPAKVA